MFSSRLDVSFSQNQLTQLLNHKREAGEEILDLTISNPTRVGLSFDSSTILQSISDHKSLDYTPDPQGLEITRQAIVDYYRHLNETVSIDNVFCTSCTSEAYSYLFKLLTDPGDEILVPRPGYPLFEMLAHLESIYPQYYSLEYDTSKGWSIDRDSLINQISSRTKAIVIVNPNNPTGSYVSAEEITFLNELCTDYSLALIADEVFYDYKNSLYTNATSSLCSNVDSLTFVLSGLSKICALPQLKLSWIHISGPKKLRTQARLSLEYIADTFLSVNIPIQYAAPTLLEQRSQIQQQIDTRLENNESFLINRCNEANTLLHVLKRQGGWYAVIALAVAISDETVSCSLLRTHNVLIHPGYFYDFEKDSFLVVSLLTDEEVFKEGIRKLVSFLECHSQSCQ